MALRYILPFVGYLLGTNLASIVPAGLYPLAYCGVVLIVGTATIWLLRGQSILRLHLRLGIPVLVGLVGIALWIGISHLHLEEAVGAYLPAWLQPEARVGFDPFDEISNPTMRWLFISVRLIGLAALVPVAEELFWRGFLMRWLIADKWTEAPIGQYSTFSFVVVTLAFTLAHPEWFAACVYCVLLNGLLYWRKDLWDCVIAHAVSNLVLAAYVLITAEWWLW